jgi:protein-disulfide isomerase
LTRRRFVGVLAAAAALAVALVAASQLGARDRESGPRGAAPSALDGIPQRGLALGAPDAPVTLVEYADLQCPYCADWSVRTFPVLVERYVRTGKLRIVFRGLAFLGPDSDTALRIALAATPERRLWQVVEALYRRQGPENSGWVTEALVREVARDAGLDPGALRDRRHAPWVDAELRRAAGAATAAGVQGTPAFQLGPTGGKLELVWLSSLGPEGISPAIDALLRG